MVDGDLDKMAKEINIISEKPRAQTDMEEYPPDTITRKIIN